MRQQRTETEQIPSEYIHLAAASTPLLRGEKFEERDLVSIPEVGTLRASDLEGIATGIFKNWAVTEEQSHILAKQVANVVLAHRRAQKRLQSQRGMGFGRGHYGDMWIEA